MSNQVNPQQKIVMTLGDLQEVLNYVSTRPYAEVFKVVDILRTAKTLEAVNAEEAISKAAAAAQATLQAAPEPAIEETPATKEA